MASAAACMHLSAIDIRPMLSFEAAETDVTAVVRQAQDIFVDAMPAHLKAQHEGAQERLKALGEQAVLPARQIVCSAQPLGWAQLHHVQDQAAGCSRYLQNHNGGLRARLAAGIGAAA